MFLSVYLTNMVGMDNHEIALNTMKHVFVRPLVFFHETGGTKPYKM